MNTYEHSVVNLQFLKYNGYKDIIKTNMSVGSQGEVSDDHDAHLPLSYCFQFSVTADLKINLQLVSSEYNNARLLS